MCPLIDLDQFNQFIEALIDEIPKVEIEPVQELNPLAKTHTITKQFIESFDLEDNNLKLP